MRGRGDEEDEEDEGDPHVTVDAGVPAARAAALGWLTDSASLSAGHRLGASIALLSLKLWQEGREEEGRRRQKSKQNKTMNR